MGKPYQTELSKIGEVYDWAVRFDIQPLVDLVRALSAQPLLAIGSGGSFTAAHVAAHFHERYAQKLARSVTPLEALSLPILDDIGVLIVTGGGRNPDVLSCLRHLAELEPQQLGVLCASTGTPLATLAQKYWYTQLIEFRPPSRKDGFIATNSLLATTVLLARSYGELYGDDPALPDSVSGLMNSNLSGGMLALKTSAERLAQVDSLVVLYGPTGLPAAQDLESKCSETGLANIQLSDYRNFAHGRHHGLSIRSSNTGVLAIVTPDDITVATKTLDLLPTTIAADTIHVHARGANGVVSSLLSVFHWVGFRAQLRGTDPGRPSVADFGRKLYHLNVLGRESHLRRSAETLAIERKTQISVDRLENADVLDRWKSALQATLEHYRSARFRALVFDYDGTLCTPQQRYKGIEGDIATALERLLAEGIIIGIATGRGKSVRIDLQAKLQREYWKRVWIGYYNAGQIGPLDQDSIPDKTIPMHDSLAAFVSLIESDERFGESIDLDLSSNQITVFPKACRQDNLWEALQQFNGARHSIVRSIHSFDVLAPGVSKLNLVARIREALAQADPINVLRIGDLGRWPGNDYQLLADPCGLSVDQVSAHPAQCWNFAPAGHRGTQATLDYVNAITFSDGIARLDVARLGFET